MAVEYAILEWIDRYDSRRLLAPIGNVPHTESEARDHANVGDQASAAGPKTNSLQETRGGSVPS
ncbi:hypothetical protein SAMN04487844_11767 [Methylobacterium sp. yr596]|jgi:putative transposase|nr:hypothetical protein SAMN04487844_11767 [Methylobacterium sp. yr596]